MDRQQFNSISPSLLATVIMPAQKKENSPQPRCDRQYHPEKTFDALN
jgi:hypothetical protein